MIRAILLGAGLLIAFPPVSNGTDSGILELGLEWESQGDRLLVTNVWTGSASDEAGVLIGDSIVSINGSPATTERVTGETMLGLLGVDGHRRAVTVSAEACKTPPGISKPHAFQGAVPSHRQAEAPVNPHLLKLLSPMRNTVLSDRKVAFSWRPVRGAGSYELKAFILRRGNWISSDWPKQPFRTEVTRPKYCCWTLPFNHIEGRHSYFGYVVTALGKDREVLARSSLQDGTFVYRDDSVRADLSSLDLDLRYSAWRRVNNRCYSTRQREAAILARKIRSPDRGEREAALYSLSAIRVPFDLSWVNSALDSLDDSHSGVSPEAARFVGVAIQRMPESGITLEEALPVLIRARNRPEMLGIVHAAVEKFSAQSPKMLGTLKEWLRDQDSGKRGIAAMALGRMGADAGAAVPELAALIGSEPDPWVRKQAVGALALIGPRARLAVPALIRLLEDPVVPIQIAAIEALGNIGPDAAPAVKRLMEFLEDKKYIGIGCYYRGTSQGLLVIAPVHGGPAQAAGIRSGDLITEVNGRSLAGASPQAMRNLFEGTPGSQVVVTILRRSGRGSAGQTLKMAIARGELVDDSPARSSQGIAAITSLGKIGGPASAVVPELLAILRTPGTTSLSGGAIITALAALAGQDEAVRKELDRQLASVRIREQPALSQAYQQRLIQVLAKAGPEGAAFVVRALDDPALQGMAQGALMGIGSLPPETLLVLAQHPHSGVSCSTLLRSLKESSCDDETRLKALSTLLDPCGSPVWCGELAGQIGALGEKARPAVPAMYAVLAGTQATHHCAQYIGAALEKILSEKEVMGLATDLIEGSAASGRPGDGLSWGLRMLKKFGPSAAPMLGRILSAESVRGHPSRRSELMRILGGMGTAGAEVLSRHLDDPEMGREASSQLLNACSQAGSPGLKFLDMILRSTNTAVDANRSAAAWRASQLGVQGASLLAGYAGDRNMSVRNTVSSAVMSHRAELADEISSILEGTDPVARTTIENGLMQHADKTFIGPLTRAARIHGDVQAVHAIVKIKPDCATALARVLENPHRASIVEPAILLCYDSAMRGRSQLGGPLHRMLKDPDGRVRAGARETLSLLGVPGHKIAALERGSVHFAVDQEKSRSFWLRRPGLTISLLFLGLLLLRFWGKMRS